MEIAVLLAAGLRAWIDFGVIIGILLLNAVVGWYQEKQAADVVASLKGDIAMKATVVRDGLEQEILAREIVPGDIVSFTWLPQSTTRSDANNYTRLFLRVVATERLFQVNAVLSALTTTGRTVSPITRLRCVPRVLPAARLLPTPMMRRKVSHTEVMLSSLLISRR